MEGPILYIWTLWEEGAQSTGRQLWGEGPHERRQGHGTYSKIQGKLLHALDGERWHKSYPWPYKESWVTGIKKTVDKCINGSQGPGLCYRLPLKYIMLLFMVLNPHSDQNTTHHSPPQPEKLPGTCYLSIHSGSILAIIVTCYNCCVYILSFSLDVNSLKQRVCLNHICFARIALKPSIHFTSKYLSICYLQI